MNTKKPLKIILQMTFVLTVLFFIILFPMIFEIRNHNVEINPMNAINAVKNLIVNIDKFNIYKIGKTSFEMTDSFPSFIYHSLVRIFITSISALFIGLILSFIAYYYKLPKLVAFFNLFSSVPNFIIVLVIQVGAIFLNKYVGARVIGIVYGYKSHAYLLTYFPLILVGVAYIINSTTLYFSQIEKNDYILFAKAKGLSNFAIVRRHIFPGVLKKLETNLIQISAVIFANLIVLERVLNLPGITRLLFNYAFVISRGWAYIDGDFRTYSRIDAQLNILLVGLLFVILLLVASYLIFRVLLKLVRYICLR